MVNRSGQQLGHYKLVRLIGRGGSADVYLARNLNLSSCCAIKILRTPLMHKGRHTFLEEARVAASLEHDHIVRVLDFDVQNGMPFIVMSYAPNGSLRNYHPRGTRLSFSTILRYLEQIADALDYLHAKNFIHLDIKSENLLVGRNGEVLLGDFGITEALTQTIANRVQTGYTFLHVSRTSTRQALHGKRSICPRCLCLRMADGTISIRGYTHRNSMATFAQSSTLITLSGTRYSAGYGTSGAARSIERPAATLSQRGSICGCLQGGHAACDASRNSRIDGSCRLV